MKKSNLTSVIVAVSIVLIIGVYGAISLTTRMAKEKEIAGTNRAEGTCIITVTNSTTLEQVADMLYKEGAIEKPKLFIKYFTQRNLRTKFGEGDITLETNMSYMEIAEALNKNNTMKITIPEGWELKQIVKYLISKNLGTEQSINDAIKNGDYDYDFIEKLEKTDNRLEGYLYPDTYEIYCDEEPESIFKRMIANFAKKTKDLRDECESQEKDFNDVVILASIIEREAQNSDEFDLVSSVFTNRIKKSMKLESCATVQYILGERKPVLSIEDTKIDSPYNTYQNLGLPVGPIACPSIEAMEAALKPASTKYLYFRVSPSTGKHVFSETYAQHQAVK